jgi:hypothetical protein
MEIFLVGLALREVGGRLSCDERLASMTNPLLGLIPATGASLSELDARARDIFRRIVETYLETGEASSSLRRRSATRCRISPSSACWGLRI